MLRNSVRLFTVGGIEVGVHVSWLFIFGLVTWSLATGFFPDAYRQIANGERLSTLNAWGLAVIAALLLFASVLVHELAHSFVARARGLEARSITLFLFGGVSNLAAESPSPGTEFLVAIVGPLTSLLLAGLAFAGSVIVADPQTDLVLAYLAVVNALVAGFNLIPGFPLDGGRVLRSIAWKITNDLRRATQVAAVAGQVVGFLLIAWGLVTLFLPPAGDAFSGIWIAAIGWFLQNAASASMQQVARESQLSGVYVRDVLRPDTSAVAPEDSVADVIEQHLLRRNRRAMPVCVNGRPIGIVTIGDIAKVPAEHRATTRVSQVMGGADNLSSVSPQSPLTEALQRFNEDDYDQIPVVEDGRLVGMLTRGDVLRQLQLREELEIKR